LPSFATDLWRRRQTTDGSPDRPLALVARQRGREIVFAVDAAAAALGLQPGLPLADARAICPALRAVPQDGAGDAAALRELALWCAGRYSPWAAPCTTVEGSVQGLGGAGGLLLDITGCAQLFLCPSKGRAAGVDGPDGSAEACDAGERALLEDLCARLQGLGFAVRLGLADTPGAAWALARFAEGARFVGEGRFVGGRGRPWAAAAPGGQRRALGPLPPRALRLTAAQDELMARFGLTRIAQLLALPRALLVPRFGRSAALRLAQALGEEGEAISPLEPPPRHRVRQVFAEPIAAPESIAAGLALLLPALCRDLAAARQGARELIFTCYRVDGSRRRLVRRTSRPSRDPRQLTRLFAEALPAIDPGFGVDALVLAAQVTEPLGAEQLSFQVPDRASRALLSKVDAPSPDDRALAALADRLTARLGAGRVSRPWPRESHIPEGAVALLPPFAQIPAVTPAAKWRRGAVRPPRLLSRPEPIEAMALLPDRAPAQFRWRRRLHRVIAAEGPERLTAEWWRSDAALEGQPHRDYFRVEDSEGYRYWIYRGPERWYLHGLFP